MSLELLYRLVKTSVTVECNRDFKLDGDLSEVLELQTNVTVLKLKVKVRVWNIGSQLEHRCSYSLKLSCILHSWRWNRV